MDSESRAFHPCGSFHSRAPNDLLYSPFDSCFEFIGQKIFRMFKYSNVQQPVVFTPKTFMCWVYCPRQTFLSKLVLLRSNKILQNPFPDLDLKICWKSTEILAVEQKRGSVKSAKSYQSRIETLQIGHAPQTQIRGFGFCLKPSNAYLMRARVRRVKKRRRGMIRMVKMGMRRNVRFVCSIWQSVCQSRPHLTDPCVECCHCHPHTSSVFLGSSSAVCSCAVQYADLSPIQSKCANVQMCFAF